MGIITERVEQWRAGRLSLDDLLDFLRGFPFQDAVDPDYPADPQSAVNVDFAPRYENTWYELIDATTDDEYLLILERLEAAKKLRPA